MYATYERRWWTLTILCLSLVVIILGNTVLNVALPTLQRELGATATQLQWMVDAYSLVFAGLLLTAGALGDRFGRKGFLTLGLSIFGLAALAATQATQPWHIIATRAVMGMGAAFVMPATLSILTNVFPPQERAKAIGIWAGLAGGGAAIGPIAGGFLLQHFSWSSVFYLNIPVVVIGIIGGAFLVPTSKDPEGHPLDPIGAVLSIAGLTALIYGVIEGPNHGWLSGESLLTFAVAVVLLGGFAVWEVRSSEPMLDLKFFANPRFSAASGAIMVLFMVMMGMFFLLTQYLQFGRGYTALSAGLHSLPMPLAMMFFASTSPKFVERFGPRKVVTLGMTLTGLGVLGLSMLDISTPYVILAVALLIMGAGAGMVMPPSTTSIMSTLPLGKAGVGSAVNDTTREIGAALGVGIMGSVLASQYQSSLKSAIASLPAVARAHANTGVGEALQIAQRLGGTAGGRLAEASRTAFIDGMQVSLWVAFALILVGGIAVNRTFPSHAEPHPEPEYLPEEADVDGPEVLEPVDA
jgi:EmrB/QacA subfamily drug resistance transporter